MFLKNLHDCLKIWLLSVLRTTPPTEHYDRKSQHKAGLKVSLNVSNRHNTLEELSHRLSEERVKEFIVALFLVKTANFELMCKQLRILT